MTAADTAAADMESALLQDFSLEMTARDVPALDEAQACIPLGTRINVTFLGTEDHRSRLEAARAVRERGFVPVPHISARRLVSREELERFVAGLTRIAAVDQVFAVGGDPAAPAGPFDDSLALLRSGVLQENGVRHVGIAGYPEGHPDIAEEALWASLTAKAELLASQGLSGSVITQFVFDAERALDYTAAVRARGIELPIRIGVPGPAGIKRLLGYARRFGVGTGAGIARKYGLSLTNLLGTAGPERFLSDLAEGFDPGRHGRISLHFYTFGGLAETCRWITGHRS